MAPETTPTETPQPSESESRLWEWMEQAAAESNRVRRHDADFDKFERWLDVYHGRHFPEAMPSYRPPVVVNELQTLMLNEASDLSDALFRVYVIRDPRTGERDKQAEKALRALWTREQIDLRLIEAIVWAELGGTGFLRVGWNPDSYYGLGDVSIEALDPRFVLPDPDAMDDRTWQFVATETVLDLATLRRLFPQKAHLIKPDDKYSERHGMGDQAPTGLQPTYPYQGPLSVGNSLLGGYPGYKKARVRTLDFHVRDDSLETVVEQARDPQDKELRDENDNPILAEIRRMKYPRGRRMVGANGIILYDGQNTNPGGDFGILRVVLEPALAKFWGTGFIQKTGELQLAADKLASAVVENAIRLNNGIVKSIGNTGLDWETFSSIPGQIVQINRDSNFEIMYPPAMPPDMVQAPWRMLDMQRRILGFPDPRTGTSGRGNVSPELTETEISQSQGVTRLRAKMLYHTVQRLAEMIFARMAFGYTSERAIPLSDGAQFDPAVWKPIEDPSKYSVYVDPSSFQVMSKSMLRRLAVALYRMGVIDRRAALDTIGWPDAEAIAKRMDEADRAAAMAKLQAQRKRSTR